MRHTAQPFPRAAVAARSETPRLARAAALFLALALLAGFAASRAAALDSENIRAAKALSNAYAEVVEHVGSAVVGIETEKRVTRGSGPSGPMGEMGNPFEFFERFFGPDMSPFGQQMPPRRGAPRRENETPEKQPEEELRTSGIGSGVVIDAEGHILTNNHVVADADNIKVEFAHEKGRIFKAEVVGRDENSDLAVIRLTELPDVLPVAELGDSDALLPGNIVIAIGSPLGFKQSVTTGVVSAKGRNLGELAYERFIQTDASINPGNSGGPLVNLDGEVVGLNTMISVRPGSSGSIGIGFAIPINQAKNIIRQLIETGSVTRGWLGITMNAPENKELSIEFGHDGTGVLIAEVDPEGPAKKADIRPGDLIIEFDGTAVKDNEHLRYMVADIAPNTVVPVVLLRDGRRVGLDLTIEAQPSDLYSRARTGGPSRDDLSGSDEVASSLGLTVRNLDDATRKQFGIPAEVESGVVVTEVDNTGEARNQGIRPGNVILQMDRQDVTGVADFRRILKDSAGKKRIPVYLRYGDAHRWVVVNLQ